MSDHSKQARNNNDVLVSGGTRQAVKKAVREQLGKEYKVKTAGRLSKSQKERSAFTVSKRKKTGEVKKVMGGTRVPKFAIIKPKRKKIRGKTNTPSL